MNTCGGSLGVEKHGDEMVGMELGTQNADRERGGPEFCCIER